MERRAATFSVSALRQTLPLPRNAPAPFPRTTARARTGKNTSCKAIAGERDWSERESRTKDLTSLWLLFRVAHGFSLSSVPPSKQSTRFLPTPPNANRGRLAFLGFIAPLPVRALCPLG